MDINKNDIVYAKPGTNGTYYTAPDPTKRGGTIDAVQEEIPVVLGAFTGNVKKNGNLEYLEIAAGINVPSTGTGVVLVYVTTYDFDYYWIREVVVTATKPVTATPPVETTTEPDIIISPTTKTVITDPATISNPFDGLDFSFNASTSNKNEYWIYGLVAVSVLGLIVVIVKTQFPN